MTMPKGTWAKIVDDDENEGGAPQYNPDAMLALAQQDTQDTDDMLGKQAAALEQGDAAAPPEPKDDGPLKYSPFAKLAEAGPSMPKVDPGADDERAISAGRDRDNQTRLMRAIELGGKQFNSALGGIPVAELATPASTSFEKDATARADRGEAKRYQRSQAEIAAAHQRAMMERQQRNDAASAAAKADAKARQGVEDAYRRDEDIKRHQEHETSVGLAAENNRIMQGMAAQGLHLRQDEHDDKRGDKADAQSASDTEVDGVTFVAPKGVSAPQAHDAQVKAGLLNAAFGELDGVRDAVKKYVAHPSLETFDDISSRGFITAQAMTAAGGGGAMSKDEAKEAIGAMGADPTSARAMKALWDSQFSGMPPEQAAKMMLNKLNAARDTFKRGAIAGMRSRKYAPASSVDTATSVGTSRPIMVNQKTGERRYKNPDGTLGEVVK